MAKCLALLVALDLALVACSPARMPTVLTPGGTLPTVDWTKEERGRDVALRTIRTTESASYHAVRLAGKEKPHVHDRSDLTVVVLKGEVRMHLGDHVTTMKPGDVVEIPRGVPHWAENRDGDPSEAYLVAAPPLDRTDVRPVE